MGDELDQELLEMVFQDADRSHEEQKERLKHIKTTLRYAQIMGMDIIHSEHELKKSVKTARDNTYITSKRENLDELLRNWDDKEKRKKLLNKYKDIEISRPMSEGVKGASLLKKRFGGGDEFEF